jgi:hypothetical protein
MERAREEPSERSREQRLRERDEEPGKPESLDATDPTADDPHHALNNPADEPDPTEFPDPYDRRPDPRDPAAVDTPAMPAERERGGTGNETSTSEPHPPRDYDELKPVKGDREG